METSDSNNEDVHSYLMCKEITITHIFVSFDVEHNIET